MGILDWEFSLLMGILDWEFSLLMGILVVLLGLSLSASDSSSTMKYPL